jgi:ribosomal protein L40E
MILLGAILLTLAVLAFVGYPLLRSRPVEEELQPDEKLRELLEKRDALYSAITELRFDYELGNLSPQDHQQLEEKYKQKAISILKELDTRGKRTAEEEIEEEIRRLRGRRVAAEQEIEQEVRRLRGKQTVSAETLVCPRCGERNAASAGLCKNCGSALTLSCLECGAEQSVKARFCSQCGARLSREGTTTS